MKLTTPSAIAQTLENERLMVEMLHKSTSFGSNEENRMIRGPDSKRTKLDEGKDVGKTKRPFRNHGIA